MDKFHATTGICIISTGQQNLNSLNLRDAFLEKIKESGKLNQKFEEDPIRKLVWMKIYTM